VPPTARLRQLSAALHETGGSPAYVDITRGQVTNRLYLTRPADPLGGEALPAIPPLPIDDAVTRRLARSTGELTAWKLHQASTERTLRRDIEAIGF
jgi:hypothetical protein